MAQTRPNKMVTITNDEVYDLATHLARLADSAGVVVGVSGASERDGLAALWPGGVLPIPFYVSRKDVPGAPLEIWDGTNWSRYTRSHAKAAGTASIGIVPAGGLTGPFAQVFPAGRFSVAPIVLVNTDQTRLVAVAADVTTTGFNLYLQNVTSGASANGQLRWTAEQSTATSAAG